VRVPEDGIVPILRKKGTLDYKFKCRTRQASSSSKGNFKQTCNWSFHVASMAARDITIEQAPWWQSSLRDNLLSVVGLGFNKPLNNLCTSVHLKNNQQFRPYCPRPKHCSDEKINLYLFNLLCSSNFLWTTVLKPCKITCFKN
jgi:hypothetical protein